MNLYLQRPSLKQTSLRSNCHTGNQLRNDVQNKTHLLKYTNNSDTVLDLVDEFVNLSITLIIYE